MGKHNLPRAPFRRYLVLLVGLIAIILPAHLSHATTHNAPLMEFTKIHSDIECQCVGPHTRPNLTDLFMMAIKEPTLAANDVQTLWERGRRGNGDDEGCEITCKRKGLSMNRWFPNGEAEVIAKYQATLAIKPRGPKYFCRLRTLVDAGVFWRTPSRADPSHHTFFKSDGFTLSHVQVLHVGSL